MEGLIGHWYHCPYHGQAVIFANLLKALVVSKKMLVLVHKEKLICQARDKIIAANPEATPKIAQEEREVDPEGNIVIVSLLPVGMEND